MPFIGEPLLPRVLPLGVLVLPRVWHPLDAARLAAPRSM